MASFDYFMTISYKGAKKNIAEMEDIFFKAIGESDYNKKTDPNAEKIEELRSLLPKHDSFRSEAATFFISVVGGRRAPENWSEEFANLFNNLSFVVLICVTSNTTNNEVWSNVAIYKKGKVTFEHEKQFSLENFDGDSGKLLDTVLKQYEGYSYWRYDFLGVDSFPENEWSEILSKDPRLLDKFPDEKKTIELCLAAANSQSKGFSLGYVPEKLRTLDVCVAALVKNKFSISDVPKKLQSKARKIADEKASKITKGSAIKKKK
jgi:hypothetical protein